ncbi:creatininase family protein [Micromonospora zamorensis]|uniref:creatininase family protein n=1 Tax=Micromonospora TaxID=1873 RepID=UPI001FFCE9CF|nr:creatininase family protein [Micromonospora sp. M61]
MADLVALTDLVAPHGARLSRNARREFADGAQERFVNQRCHGAGLATARQRLDELVEALRYSDEADSLTRSGVEHPVLINGHGGNYVLSNVVQGYTAASGLTMSLYPQGHDWTKARTDAGMETNSHEDMHAGELEP